jgi:ABC-type branched-subunit amino acid transport system substrate-binding protein
MKKFAILYPSDDYGTEMMNLFRDEVLRQGGEICRVESYAIDQTDFSKEIKLLTGINLTENDTGDEEPSPIVNFDVLFIPDSYLRIRMIAPQLAFYNVTNVQLMGTSIWNSPDLLAKDSNYLEGAIFADGLFLGSFRHDAGNFIDRFYASFRREPCTLEAVAYDATDIMIKAIEKKNTEIRDDLKDSILRYKNNDNIIGKTSFSETGNAVKSLYILTVMDGEIVQID